MKKKTSKSNQSNPKGETPPADKVQQSEKSNDGKTFQQKGTEKKG